MPATDPTSYATLLTPQLSAAIAVLRVAGPAVPPFLARHFTKPPAVGRCVHGLLRDASGSTIDDPVVVLCNPMLADINLHGGPQVVRAAIDLCRHAGFSIVEVPPESPLPAAAVAEATDIIEAEMLQSLPLARTELALRALLAQPAAWARLQQSMQRHTASAEQLLQVLADRSLAALLSLPRVAIIGPPNVGKSTLANRLFGQQRSIVADLPGTTRDWVGETADIDGLAVMLIDTPGRRSTADPIEHAAIAASAAPVAAADLVILVLNQSAPLPAEAAALRQEHPQALLVANKADLAPAWDAGAAGALSLAAGTGQNLHLLKRAVLRHFGCADLALGLPRCWTDRQRELIQQELNQLCPPPPLP